MQISNPITPHTSELRQSIQTARWQIENIKNFRSNAKPELWPALNIQLDCWLGRLAKLEEELKCLS